MQLRQGYPLFLAKSSIESLLKHVLKIVVIVSHNLSFESRRYLIWLGQKVCFSDNNRSSFFAINDLSFYVSISCPI